MTRIGAVPYLNARPLVRWLQTSSVRKSGVRLQYAAPSTLAQLLDEDKLDIAMFSSIYALRRADTQTVPGYCVGSWGPVMSVRLFSICPIDRIRSVSLDSSSLTSCALARVLLENRYRVRPSYISHTPDLNIMLQHTDAALLIGDPGLRADGSGLHVLDLGEAWSDWTGLPFVWALWIAGPGRLSPDITAILQTAAARGLATLTETIEQDAQETGLPVDVVRRYLTQAMRYPFDMEAQRGLARFRIEVATLD